MMTVIEIIIIVSRHPSSDACRKTQDDAGNEPDIKKDNHHGTYFRTRRRSALAEQGMRR